MITKLQSIKSKKLIIASALITIFVVLFIISYSHLNSNTLSASSKKNTPERTHHVAGTTARIVAKKYLSPVVKKLRILGLSVKTLNKKLEENILVKAIGMKPAGKCLTNCNIVSFETVLIPAFAETIEGAKPGNPNVNSIDILDHPCPDCYGRNFSKKQLNNVGGLFAENPSLTARQALKMRLIPRDGALIDAKTYVLNETRLPSNPRAKAFLKQYVANKSLRKNVSKSTKIQQTVICSIKLKKKGKNSFIGNLKKEFQYINDQNKAISQKNAIENRLPGIKRLKIDKKSGKISTQQYQIIYRVKMDLFAQHNKYKKQVENINFLSKFISTGAEKTKNLKAKHKNYNTLFNLFEYMNQQDAKGERKNIVHRCKKPQYVLTNNAATPLAFISVSNWQKMINQLKKY